MKKTAKVKPKAAKAKAQKKKMVTRKVPSSTPAPQAKRNPTDDPAFQQAVRNYEDGLKAMQARKFDRAKQAFEKVVAGPRELADRAAVHLNTCNQQLARTTTSFKTPEEHYDYAVSLMNMGDFVAAREQLEKLAKTHSKLDFVWYGYAALECLTGHYPEALRNLSEAIRLNPGNRFQARNDSDFKNMADDPRFTELLYPEGAALSS